MRRQEFHYCQIYRKDNLDNHDDDDNDDNGGNDDDKDNDGNWQQWWCCYQFFCQDRLVSVGQVLVHAHHDAVGDDGHDDHVPEHYSIFKRFILRDCLFPIGTKTKPRQ